MVRKGTDSLFEGKRKDSGAKASEPKPSSEVHPRNTLNDLTGTEWVKFTKSWVKCDGKKWQFTKDIEMHPASFPPELIAEFIRFFTKEGQVVLDPFVGCGSTLQACIETGRRGIGIELSPKYYEATVKRMTQVQPPLLEDYYPPQVIHGDAQDLSKMDLSPIDFCITSPPYCNMLHTSRGGVKSTAKKRAELGLDQVYSDDPRDLGNIDEYSIYLQTLRSIFDQVYDLLRDGRYLVVILQNIRLPGGEMLPVAWDLAKLLGQKYVLRQEKIWVQDQKMLGVWGYPTTYVSNVHHHYCLIFQKV